MARRILLLSLNQCDSPYPVFPLGLACVDTALRRAGHVTRCLDLYADHGSLTEAVAEFQPDFVGISLRNIDDVLIRNRQTYFDPLAGLCRELRRLRPCPVILGGSGFSIFPEPLLRLADADFGITGEGEASLVALLAALESGRDYAGIAGLVFRRGDRIVCNPQHGAVPPGELAAPDRSPRLTDFYLQRSAILSVQTQRGCGFRCCYCTYPLIEGRTCRRREPEAVAEEFAGLQRRGARYVFIVDSVFNSSAAHVSAVCEALLRRGVKLPWGCFLRPKGLTRDLMDLMRRAGLADIEFGADSFCDAVLEAYGKRLTFGDILRSSELAARAGVAYCHFLICGGPGETRATLAESFAHSQRLPSAVVLALVGMRVYPGTPLHARACAEGALAPDADLLHPQYYLAPALTEEEVFAVLRAFARQSPSWIVGDLPPEYDAFAARLRAKGVVGPLWKYFPLLRLLFPARVAVPAGNEEKCAV
jgi:radical SAM superfamily enzyme YgiQ (UPF0313 family)